MTVAEPAHIDSRPGQDILSESHTIRYRVNNDSAAEDRGSEGT